MAITRRRCTRRHRAWDEPARRGHATLGFPRSLAALPDGDYYAQAVVNVYENVHRADGKSVRVHVNDGSVEFFSIAPGNLYSAPPLVHVTRDGMISIPADRVIPPATRPANTQSLAMRLQHPDLFGGV